MADAKYRFLQQAKMLGHPISADDAAFIKSYEKQKLLVPAATANIKLQGMGTLRQFPVYDNQTKQTVYMDSNEINDAKLREPGRYTVPQFTGEAITEQATAKDFASSGKSGQALIAFKTAGQHADLLAQAADALNNGNVRALNTIGNQLGVQFGSDKATN